MENGGNLVCAGGNIGSLGLRPLKHIPTWYFLLPKLRMLLFFFFVFVFSGVLLWQSDFYPDHFSLWANSTLHLSRIVILSSEWEYFYCFC